MKRCARGRAWHWSAANSLSSTLSGGEGKGEEVLSSISGDHMEKTRSAHEVSPLPGPLPALLARGEGVRALPLN